jgi:transposase
VSSFFSTLFINGIALFVQAKLIINIIEIGLLVIKKFKIDTSYAHLDSTSFHLHGEYNNIEIAENDQERPILITKGYSRDHRPDLTYIPQVKM